MTLATTTGYKFATGWRIDRGRAYELDKTSVGTAEIDFADKLGDLDPTNSAGPFYGDLNPLKPAGISLQNPVTGGWSSLFRGYTSAWEYDLYVTETLLTGRINLVDSFEVLAAYEVIPGQVGTTVPSGSEGNAYYAAQNVDDRIRAAIADAKFPSALTDVFSGNVTVQNTVYPPRQTILAVLQDAADAEFPGVANIYISKEGIFTFHGRYARFNPANASYRISHWHAGDLAAIAAGSGNIAPISSLNFSRDKDHIYNAVLSTPQNIDQGTAATANQIAGQFVSDATSITDYGPRSLSFENLLTNTSLQDGSNDLDETRKFAHYYVDNYATPRNRINQVTFRSLDPSDANAAPLWKVMCGVEIGDLIDITTTHPGGGGFNAEPFFVEGIHYDAKPLHSSYPDVTLTLDLSPQAWFPDSYNFHAT